MPTVVMPCFADIYIFVQRYVIRYMMCLKTVECSGILIVNICIAQFHAK